jgi:hypothetical protein
MQYVDDLLTESPGDEECLFNTILVLNHLAGCGYSVIPENLGFQAQSKLPWVSIRIRNVEPNVQSEISNCQY